MERDLFGELIIKNALLRDKFIEPPFSILNTMSGSWLNRKRKWLKIGIRSELGRDVAVYDNCSPSMYSAAAAAGTEDKMSHQSIFDPVLCEVLYHWFCKDGGHIFDPFAGGSVRGIVAGYLGYKYTGVDIRQEQVDSNTEQIPDIKELQVAPKWICGDSNIVLDSITDQYDFVFSCPPYADLEVYSDLQGDISNMSYAEFVPAYTEIIKKSCSKLKSGGYACFVVGEVRDKKGNYYGFVPDTIQAFTEGAGMFYYNEAILLNSIGSARIRAGNSMKNQKLVKVHQNVLIFKKP